MKNIYLFTVLMALATFWSSCGSSVEGETASWKSNQERITRLKANYPGFKGALDAALNDAKTAMESAQSVGDKEAKIKAMSAANDKASPQFVRELDGMDRLMRDIEGKISKTKQAGGDRNDQSAIWDAANRADQAIREAKSKLKSSTAADIASANAITSSVTSNLKSVQSLLDDIAKEAKNKADAAKKAEDDKKAAAAKADEDAKKAAAPIKCGACGTENKAGSTKCSQCTAPL